MRGDVFDLEKNDVFEWNFTDRWGTVTRFGPYRVVTVADDGSSVATDVPLENGTHWVARRGEHYNDMTEFLVTERNGVKVSDETLPATFITYYYD